MMVVSNSCLSLHKPLFTHHPSNAIDANKSRGQKTTIFNIKKTTWSVLTSTNSLFSSPCCIASSSLNRSVPIAVSLAMLFCSNPVNAGILSGSTGIESIPGPQLPQIDFLNKFNEENQKKYAEFDERFKSSPLLKQYLERTKLNKEKNKQEIQDKYCIRGAEWGVGDCSAEGMTVKERDDFIAMLKQKAGVE